MPYFRVKPVAATEGAGFVDFVISLDQASTNEIRVNYDTDIGTATYGTNQPDYLRAFGTLVFAPGQTSQTLRVNLVANTLLEPTELFWLDLSSAVNATVPQRYTPALIFDNDALSGTPAIAVTDAVVDESAGVANFFVWLSRPSSGTVSVSYAMVDDSARAGQDYADGAGLLIFAAGEMVKTVSVAILNDSVAEADEFFKLQVSNPSNATLIDATGLAQIGANDAALVSAPTITAKPVATDESQTLTGFTVQLSAPSPNEVKVNFDTSIGTATYGTNDPDYQRVFGTLVFAPGETTKFVTVAMVNNTLKEGTALFWLDLTAPVNATIEQRYTPALIFDNDGIAGTPAISVTDAVMDESAGTASFFVWLSRPSLSVVSVAYDSADDSARDERQGAGEAAGQDYRSASGLLTFAPGEIVKTVIIDIVNDSAVEVDEFFKLVLSTPTNASIVDPSGLAQIGANDGEPVSQPTITAKPVATDESQPMTGFTVQLSAPSPNEVTVNFDTDIGTATYGTNDPDYQRVFGTLFFAPGETTKFVAVPIVNNITVEGTALFWLDLTSPVNATIAQRYTPALMFDNDAIAGTPAIGVTDAVVDESAGTASFFVWLSRSSLSVVSVAYDTADDSARDERQGAGETLAQDFRSATGVLTFAPGEIVKTVIIDIVNDSAAEVDEFFKLVLSTPTNASIVDPSGLAQIGANDGLPVSRPTITAKPVATDENQPMTGFTVQLSAPSPNEVKVNFDTDIGTATYGTNDPDYQRVFGTLVFAPGETTKFVAVPVVNNTTVEGTGLFWLDLTSPVNATIEQRYTPALIFDNDAIAGTPAISVTDVVVDESAGTASFFVWLNRQSLSVVTVEFDTVDGSARAGEDYRDALGQLRFAPGEVVKTVSVDIANDQLAETDEVFTLRLANPVNATLHDAVAGAVIGRNDTAPVVQPQITAGQLTVSEADTSAGFVVQLSAPSDRTVTVNFDTAIGTATYGTNSPDFQRVLGTLEFAPGQTTKWIPIPLIDNTTAEGLESFSLDLTSPVNATLAQRLTSATIIDTDSGFNVASRGIGPDQYSVGNVLDRIAESPGGGTDSVRSSVSYTLPDNVENLTLTGAALIGIGNAANNVFRGTSANNTFDGREGIDTVVVSGPLSGYVIAGNATSRTVSGAPDGSDTLLSIERLQFSNTLLANDTTPGGNTYKAYAMFNAGFNQAPSVAELSQWTSALDGLGGNLRDLAQTMITFYAPGVPNDALVTHLWGTIVGTPIPLDALALYTGLLADGTYTQASLLELVTTLDLNTNEIVGIVGQALPLDPAWFPDPGV